MLRIGRLWRGGLVGAAVVLLLLGSGCASPDTRAGRDLADTVKVDGYRKLSEKHMGETTLLYFVGPTGVDLHQAVTARNWSPGPPPSGLPEAGPFKWVIAGSANTEDHRCELAVSTLRPGFENVAIELDDKQRRDLVAGRFTYVRVACMCAGAP
jgi:hypothetical protein